MITLNLSGGLGNQMFQYAAGMSLADKLGTSLTLDLSEFSHYDLRDYMLGVYNLADNVKTKSGTSSKILQRLKKEIPNPKAYTEPHYHYDPSFFDLRDGASITGYFQSEKYFNEIADKVRKHFTVKRALSQNSSGIKQHINSASNPVSLHVRRGDYVSDSKTQQVHGSASEQYYKQAVALITERVGQDVQFFIFSDDSDYAQMAFDFCPQKFIIRGNDARPHEDMYLMSQCKHHILANSSFSWWGAWLNPNKDKTVIAPKLWFSAETLKEKSLADLFPPEWVTL